MLEIRKCISSQLSQAQNGKEVPKSPENLKGGKYSIDSNILSGNCLDFNALKIYKRKQGATQTMFGIIKSIIVMLLSEIGKNNKVNKLPENVCMAASWASEK